MYDTTKRSGKSARQSQTTSINQMLINCNLAIASSSSEKDLKDNSHYMRLSSSASKSPGAGATKSDLKFIPG